LGGGVEAYRHAAFKCEVTRIVFKSIRQAIVRAYTGGEGFVGICDGRVIARAADRAAVALALIKGPFGELEINWLEQPWACEKGGAAGAAFPRSVVAD
jgi:hypothetical protein